MADIGERLACHRRDVDLMRADPEGLHQRMCVGFGQLRGRETRQRIAKYTFAIEAEPVEGARGDDQRMCRIEATRDAEHDLLGADRLEARLEPMHLDVEGLVAIL